MSTSVHPSLHHAYIPVFIKLTKEVSLLPLLPVGRPQLLLAGALRQCYSTLIEALSPYSLSPITRYVHTSSKIKPFLLSQTNTGDFYSSQ